MTVEGGAYAGMRAMLRGPVLRVWAKHDRDSDGWLPLWRHMEDSAAVAERLWDEWLSLSVRRLIARELPDGADDARRLAVWLAGVHDIGKATPAFACQVESLAETMRTAGLEMRSQSAMGADRKLAPHGLAGQMLLGEWLKGRHGWAVSQTGQFTVAVGGHHGVPPEHGQITALDRHPELLRTPGGSEELWRRVQQELLDACAAEFGVHDRLPAWRSVKLSQPAQVALTALVIVSDWIASNPDLFPYFPQDASRSSEERIGAAWRGLNLPGAWRAEEPPADAQELFASRFALPAGAKIRPVQEAAVELARTMDEPGLLVIEAPMGEGKTEAALGAAEVLAARSGAGGVFFALPTMATGNAMFPRILKWLERLPVPEGTRHSVQLAHSKAALNQDFTDLMERGQVKALDLDATEQSAELRHFRGRRAVAAELVAHSWLRGRKKAMLSSFVAGTIDQLLFAGLKSRHLALRHLAIAGKVVVIDEAHAYDTYMSSYLDRVLSWLGAYRVPVVVLSATLPVTRRRELVEAYAGRRKADSRDFDPVFEAGDYPLLTAVAPAGVPVLRRPAASGRGADVELECIDDDLAVLADRLEGELEDGGCVLVVRNTVRRVLDAAKVLRERFGDAHVTVAHSSFIDIDRAAKDASLLERFGPPEKAEDRPVKHVVVASQVAEQSLDVDFDLLVTDLCPADLLLQRMGRLHRHPRGGENQTERPARLRTARCLVSGVDWTVGVPKPVRGSVAVYGAYALLRSAAALLPHLDGGPRRPVRLPADISPLVQHAYAENSPVPVDWAQDVEAARARYDELRADQAERAATFRLGAVARPGRPLFGWVTAGVGDADDTSQGKAQVRDSRESLEVVVVQRKSDGTLATVPWLAPDRRGRALAGLALPTDQVPTPLAARTAAACGLRLPSQFSYAETMDRAIEELEELHVPAWQVKESHWLAGQLILALGEDCQTHLAGFSLRYSKSDGLEVTHA
ncbi:MULTISPECIES: CRISPR-associated helicase Cas3' [unclassified Streptomyces]|uniref:CRISPR-associated helicase Cas3' n=1 Tax=unclassified Streptomyces TaxID=2593676 RepID=UPI0035D61919